MNTGVVLMSRAEMQCVCHVSKPGGYMEARLKLPGDDVHGGFWPASRAGAGASMGPD